MYVGSQHTRKKKTILKEMINELPTAEDLDVLVVYTKLLRKGRERNKPF